MNQLNLQRSIFYFQETSRIYAIIFGLAYHNTVNAAAEISNTSRMLSELD
jgi:hypothetical protein